MKRRKGVLYFSDYEPRFNVAVKRDEPATIIILPVIRIERYADDQARKARKALPAPR